MAKIKQMDEVLANQIAAGEVVERPASVVKELVENAIDAQATMITIELLEAGIQQIRVIDNGEGMEPEDLRLAILPHATSKIYSIHDLFNIHSLGFRGEALSSIGSVSKLTLESTQADAESGYAISVEGSRIVEETKTKARKGTTITVDSLFYNTPARLKHLKTIQTELKHTITFIQNVALAYPEIRFTLFNDGNRLFYSTGTGQLQQTIANVYSPAIARQLIQINGESLDFKVTGYISPPQMTRTSKNYLHWMINQRPIKSIVLDKILLKAYGRQLMIGRYPLIVINIELDPHLVDVNVHPTKQTVRLSKEEELAELISTLIKTYLNEINPIPEVDIADITPTQTTKIMTESVPLQFHFQTQQETTEKQQERHFSTQSLENILEQNNRTYITDLKNTQEIPRDKTNPQDEAIEDAVHDHEQEAIIFDSKQEEISHDMIQRETKDDHVQQEMNISENKPHLDFHALRYIGQIHGTYLVAESEKSFFLIDQHAAQERIRYEQLMTYSPDVLNQQQLLIPIILDFAVAEMISVEQILPSLVRVGIHLSQFSPTAYQLDEYPNWIEGDDIEKVVRDLIELMIEQPDLTIAQYLEAGIIMHSCRGAIKANHYLDERQAKALIRDMADLEDPYHCPHGRPIFVEFNEKTIEKLFKRIQDSHSTTLYD